MEIVWPASRPVGSAPIAYDGSTGIVTLAIGVGLTTLSGALIADFSAVQPYDLELTALAATSSAADMVPYYTGAGTASTTSLTAFARTCLASADAAAFRTAIGAGTSSFSGAFGALTGVPTTIAGYGITDAYTKAEVDAIAQGLDAKTSVRCASTGNLTLSGAQTIDGYSAVATDRVLVKDQTAPEENGIYVVAAGAWARATDMDAWLEVPGAFTFVEQGTVNADTGWVCTSNQGGTLGTTAVTWSQFSSAGTYTAGAGLQLVGSEFSVSTNGVTNAMLRQSAALSVVGRSANSLGDVADIAAGADGDVLRRSGTTLAFGAVPQASVTSLVADLALKAPLASPTFTGIPAAPTAAADTNTTQVATTAFVIGQAGTATPLVASAAVVGTSVKFARDDHVHPAQTSVSGNAGTATALQTSRNISGVAFNGTADINIKLDDLAAPDDNTDLNVSITAHGLAPKAPNDAAKFLDGTGAWSTPTAAVPNLVGQLRVPTSNQTLAADKYLHVAGYLTWAAGLSFTGAATARLDGAP